MPIINKVDREIRKKHTIFLCPKFKKIHFFRQNYVKTSCLFTCSAVILKEERGEAGVFSVTFTFIVLGLFNCFVLFQDCFLGIIHVTETVWVGYSDIKKISAEVARNSDMINRASHFHLNQLCEREYLILKVSEPVQFRLLCIQLIVSPLQDLVTRYVRELQILKVDMSLRDHCCFPSCIHKGEACL